MMDKDLFADFRGNRKPSSGKPGRSNPNDLKELVGEPRGHGRGGSTSRPWYYGGRGGGDPSVGSSTFHVTTRSGGSDFQKGNARPPVRRITDQPGPSRNRPVTDQSIFRDWPGGGGQA